MLTQQRRAQLDLLATVAMIVAAGVLIGATLWRPSKPVEPPAYSVGETVGQVEGLEWRKSPSTLVLFLRKGCKYCEASVPFYKRLLQTPDRSRVVVVSYDAPDVIGEYMKSQALQPDQVLSVSRGTLKLSRTPFVLLVSSTGQVVKTWLGLLSPSQEGEVLQSISKLPGQ